MTLKIVDKPAKSEDTNTVSMVDAYMEKHGRLSKVHYYLEMGDIINYVVAMGLDAMITDSFDKTSIAEDYEHLKPVYAFAVEPFHSLYSISRQEMANLFEPGELWVILHALKDVELLPPMLGQHLIPLMEIFYHRDARARGHADKWAVTGKLRKLPVFSRATLEMWGTFFWWRAESEEAVEECIDNFGRGLDTAPPEWARKK